jgi:hypothetical protein
MPRPWDWRDDAVYAPLRQCTGPGLAWEWLRRDPAYRADHAGWIDGKGEERHICPALRHGLVNFVDPDLAVPEARPVWHRSVDPAVLVVEARPGGTNDASFSLDAFTAFAALRACRCGEEHLLLSDGWRQVRLDIVAGTLRDGPVHLHTQVGDCALAPARVLAMRRLLALCGHGRFPNGLFRSPPWLAHRINELRVSDAMQDEASYQQTIRVLFNNPIPERRWRAGNEYWISRVRRLRKAALAMAAGGWRSLLK